MERGSPEPKAVWAHEAGGWESAISTEAIVWGWAPAGVLVVGREREAACLIWAVQERNWPRAGI